LPPPEAKRIPYSPERVEGAFSELRAEGVLGSSAARTHRRRCTMAYPHSNLPKHHAAHNLETAKTPPSPVLPLFEGLG
jgi:hypothetical protein